MHCYSKAHIHTHKDWCTHSPDLHVTKKLPYCLSPFYAVNWSISHPASLFWCIGQCTCPAANHERLYIMPTRRSLRLKWTDSELRQWEVELMGAMRQKIGHRERLRVRKSKREVTKKKRKIERERWKIKKGERWGKKHHPEIQAEHVGIVAANSEWYKNTGLVAGCPSKFVMCVWFIMG